MHSNYIAGGFRTPDEGCSSRGLRFEASADVIAPPRGVFRNNIIDAGFCALPNFAVEETGPNGEPRVLRSNDLVWGDFDSPYRDEGTTTLTSIEAVNALTDVLAEDNLGVDPMATFDGVFVRLADDSECIDTGTADGAPAFDGEGDARPAGNGYDIGPDEVVP